jgi:ADP-heptose:LPS heptosyltransferase
VGPGYRFYSPLFHRSVREHRRAGRRHEVEYALSFAHRAGAPSGEACFALRIPGESEEEVTRWAASHEAPPRAIVLHPGSGGSCPPWPLAHYLALAELLSREGVPVAFSVGPQDADVASGLDQAAAPLSRLPRFAGGIAATAAFLRRAAIAVGNSTGPMHLAAAIGVPTLTFHAPWPSCGPSRWGPYSPAGWALVAECEEAGRWSRRERRRRAPALMAAITPEKAAETVLALLAGS